MSDYAVDALPSYLEATGWEQERSNAGRQVWRHSSGALVYVPLEVGSDFHDLTLMATRQIADVEGRDHEDVAVDLATWIPSRRSRRLGYMDSFEEKPTSAVEFEVLGIPAPQGSKRHVGRGIMVESSKKLPPWRDAVALAARDVAAGVGMLDGPLKLTVEFRLRMPASRPARVRRVGRAWASTKPDLSKLVRSTEDALTTGGLIRDDARIAELAVSKVEVWDGWTGAVISVNRLEAL